MADTVTSRLSVVGMAMRRRNAKYHCKRIANYIPVLPYGIIHIHIGINCLQRISIIMRCANYLFEKYFSDSLAFTSDIAHIVKANKNAWFKLIKREKKAMAKRNAHTALHGTNKKKYMKMKRDNIQYDIDRIQKKNIMIFMSLILIAHRVEEMINWSTAGDNESLAVIPKNNCILIGQLCVQCNNNNNIGISCLI